MNCVWWFSTCKASTREAGAGGYGVWGLPRLCRETLCQNINVHPKNLVVPEEDSIWQLNVHPLATRVNLLFFGDLCPLGCSLLDLSFSLSPPFLCLTFVDLSGYGLPECLKYLWCFSIPNIPDKRKKKISPGNPGFGTYPRVNYLDREPSMLWEILSSERALSLRPDGSLQDESARPQRKGESKRAMHHQCFSASRLWAA